MDEIKYYSMFEKKEKKWEHDITWIQQSIKIEIEVETQRLVSLLFSVLVFSWYNMEEV